MKLFMLNGTMVPFDQLFDWVNSESYDVLQDFEQHDSVAFRLYLDLPPQQAKQFIDTAKHAILQYLQVPYIIEVVAGDNSRFIEDQKNESQILANYERLIKSPTMLQAIPNAKHTLRANLSTIRKRSLETNDVLHFGAPKKITDDMIQLAATYYSMFSLNKRPDDLHTDIAKPLLDAMLDAAPNEEFIVLHVGLFVSLQEELKLGRLSLGHYLKSCSGFIPPNVCNHMWESIAATLKAMSLLESKYSKTIQ